MADSCVCEHVDIGIGLMKVNDDPSCPCCHPPGCRCGYCWPLPLAEPDSCTHCDAPQRMHCQRYVLGVGWHGYVAPTDARRLARMLARRAVRSKP